MVIKSDVQGGPLSCSAKWDEILFEGAIFLFSFFSIAMICESNYQLFFRISSNYIDMVCY